MRTGTDGLERGFDQLAKAALIHHRQRPDRVRGVFGETKATAMKLAMVQGKRAGAVNGQLAVRERAVMKFMKVQCDILVVEDVF